MRARTLLAICYGLLVLLAPPAGAEPIVVKPGKVVLPLTGLAIELPKDARKGASWNLGGSWSLGGGGAAYDGRDVIDLKVRGRLVRGDWVSVGYFDAGGCKAVIAETALAERWTTDRELFGVPFVASGGLYDLEGELGRVPAVALCAEAPRKKSLLLYHFFVDGKAPAGAGALAPLAQDKLLASITGAWKADRWGPSQPTRRPELRQRGELPAVRDVTLVRSGLSLRLPDDGRVWLVRAGGDDEASDFLDVMAPAWPDLTVEVAMVRGHPCLEILAALMAGAEVIEEPPPAGVPSLWTAYPTIAVDGRRERVVCREVAAGALIVGLLGDPPGAPSSRDFGPYAALLQALAGAATALPAGE